MRPEPPADRTFNNADSFAQCFDEAWGRRRRAGADPSNGLLDEVLELLREHPFAAADPGLARQVGEFRIRLLGL